MFGTWGGSIPPHPSQLNPSIMPYRARRSFIHRNQRIKKNDPLKLDKGSIADLLSKGLAYETKEDKQAYTVDAKAFIEKDENTKTMYYVKRNNQIIDRLTKSKAEKLVEELNA
jgi:hypothetical protein